MGDTGDSWEQREEALLRERAYLCDMRHQAARHMKPTDEWTNQIRGIDDALKVYQKPMTFGDHEDAHRGDATQYEDLPKPATAAPAHQGPLPSRGPTGVAGASRQHVAGPPTALTVSLERWGSEPVEYVLKSAHDAKVKQLAEYSKVIADLLRDADERRYRMIQGLET